MAQILNAVLISLVAFFGFLAVFGFLQHRGGANADADPGTTGVGGTTAPGGSGHSTRTTAPGTGGSGGSGGVRIEALTLSWNTRGDAMVAQMTVRNDADSALRTTQASYAITLAGRDDAVAQGDAEPSGARSIAAHDTGTIRFSFALPDSFGQDVWTSYTGEDEAGRVTVAGQLRADLDDGAHLVPFELTSSWTGNLAAALARVSADCGSGSEDVCVVGATVAWSDDGAVDVDAEVRNDGAYGHVLSSPGAALVLAGHDVATVDAAEGDGSPVTLASGASAHLRFHLTASADALAAWWPAHAARCESSRANLRLWAEDAPGADDPFGGPGVTTTWDLPDATFATHLACS